MLSQYGLLILIIDLVLGYVLIVHPHDEHRQLIGLLQLGTLTCSSFVYNFLLFDPQQHDLGFFKIYKPEISTKMDKFLHYYFYFIAVICIFRIYACLRSFKLTPFVRRFFFYPLWFFSSPTLAIFPIGWFLETIFLRLCPKGFSQWIFIAFTIPFQMSSLILNSYNFPEVIRFTYDPNKQYGPLYRKISNYFDENFGRVLGWMLQKKKKSNKNESEPTSKRKIRIIQLTDIHIGVFVDEDRLKKISEWVLANKPDLVLLTGDYLTADTNNAYGCQSLRKGLTPLQKIRKKVFVIYGNHDLELRSKIKKVFQDLDFQLLVNQQKLIKYKNGDIIQIIGFDDYERDAKKTLKIISKFKQNEKVALRILIMHNPEHFLDLPSDDKSFIFGGHTHGGIYGFNFIGIKSSVLAPTYMDQGVIFAFHIT
ncbi:transmembrane protein with metallophosphoesterase domain-related [Anaeramoeba flamelloides]|uniref:Transmembrane protein with metallophosphoesterase domain-related n=1 Tax=Anaeramoeba flamelloides TaxID=1746091 RepID=A0AAV7ZGB4_9EUKA|nr:transmembrane protein with metallophosphoesterase domain-related [Anaeramoeba flamelloides]